VTACPDQRLGVIAHRGRASACLRSSSSRKWSCALGANSRRISHGPVCTGRTWSCERMVDCTEHGGDVEGSGASLSDYRDLFSLMRAVKLQSVFRGHRSRLLLGAARKQGPRLAATKLQAAFRGHLDRLRAQQALARKVAVLRIQRIQVAVHPTRAGGRVEAIAALRLSVVHVRAGNLPRPRDESPCASRPGGRTATYQPQAIGTTAAADLAAGRRKHFAAGRRVTACPGLCTGFLHCPGPRCGCFWRCGHDMTAGASALAVFASSPVHGLFSR
jgi:hypothetical protein